MGSESLKDAGTVSPAQPSQGINRRTTLFTGAGLGLAGVLGFKPQEAQAATPTEGSIAPYPDTPAVITHLTDSLSKQVDALNLQLEQAGISDGPGRLYANAWIDADNVTRIPYQGIIFRQLPLPNGNLIPDQTLMQIDRQGFSNGLSQGAVNGQPVDIIPLPGNGEEVPVDPKISTVVNNLSNLFNTQYRVTAAQAHEQFNVFRVATPNTEGVWEDSFALRQDYAGPRMGLITFANIAEPARLANIIPSEVLFEPGEAGTGGGETTDPWETTRGFKMYDETPGKTLIINNFPGDVPQGQVGYRIRPEAAADFDKFINELSIPDPSGARDESGKIKQIKIDGVVVEFRPNPQLRSGIGTYDLEPCKTCTKTPDRMGILGGVVEPANPKKLFMESNFFRPERLDPAYREELSDGISGTIGIQLSKVIYGKAMNDLTQEQRNHIGQLAVKLQYEIRPIEMVASTTR